MSLTELGLDALRVSLILGASFVVAGLVPRRAAALRRLVRATAFACALALPLAARVVPDVAVPEVALPAIVVRPFAEPPTDATAAAPVTRAWRGAGGTRVSLRVVAASDAALLVWALMAAALLARVGRSYAKARGVANRADFRLDPGWRAIVSEAERKRGRRVALGMTRELDTPAAFGIVSPVVLVPASSASWSASRRRAALAHELAHVDARDGLARLAAHLVCALNWFDPFAWLSARALRFDQELAADQAALEGGALPSSYASDLLAIARGARRPPIATVGMAGPSELERRVRAIVAAAPAFRAPRPLSIFAVATLAASSLVLACARPSPSDAPGGAAAAAAPAPSSAPAAVLQGADPKLQAIADEEIARLVEDTSASSAAVIALDPATGRVLAEAGRRDGARADVAFGQAFVPGSTFKLVAVAAALDAGLISSASRFDCRPRSYGAETLHDASANDELTLAEVVARSSNVGVSRIFDALGEPRFAAAARRFHFGEAPAGFPGAAAGTIPPSIAVNTFEGGMIVNGEGSQASPAQIAAAYAAIAAGGVYHAPSRTGSTGERVISEDAARAMLELLDDAVNGAKATGAAARVDGLRVAGKTGTADYSRDDGKHHIYASFVGIVPRDAPRVVLLVGAELGGAHAEDGSGGTIAAPVFARIVRRAFAN